MPPTTLLFYHLGTARAGSPSAQKGEINENLHKSHCTGQPALTIVIGLMAALARLPADGAVPAGTFRELLPAFKELLPTEAIIEKLQGGFGWTEGPVWNREGYLLFSDIPADRIIQWSPDNTIAAFRDPSGDLNGLTYDRDGRLIACEHSGRRISRTETDGTLTVLADRYQGKRLNSPNDVVVKSDGSIYFTDPPYGLGGRRNELGFYGLYRRASDGTLLLLAKDIGYPNGLVFSPDEKLLYAGELAARSRLRLRRPAGRDGGKPTAVRADRRPRWMKVDTRGNLYVAAGDGVRVLDPEGRHMGTIRPLEQPTNCAWGDADGRTLYITARTDLYRVRLTVEGIRPQ